MKTKFRKVSQFFVPSLISLFMKLFATFFILNYSIVLTAKLPSSYEAPALSLGKNASMQEIIKYYEDLYLHLNSKDYGFAQFGESCKVSNSHEIESHLDIGNHILKDQAEDRDQHRRAIEEHLYPRLRNFYHQSKSLCDFLKLLKCDPTSNQCVCADESMGIGRNESCQINIGKRCDLNSTYLAGKGIIYLPGHPLDISCIGHGECVSSLGDVSKFCRQHASPTATPTGVHQIGRSFGRSMKKPTIHTGPSPADTDEYFLYPEEIQNELIKLMSFRQVFTPEERETEASELYAAMENDPRQEEMVVRDIYLRRLASLGHGESCDPDKQGTLDNPPLAKDGSTWVDPKQEVVKQWQLHLLQGSKPFCNFAKFLKCNQSTKTCQCRVGLVLESDACLLPFGKACGPDYDGLHEFDPLKNMQRFAAPVSPDCVSGTKCRNEPLFFMKQCWCPDGINCDNSSMIFNKEFPSFPTNLTEDIQKRFSLSLGESCNPEAQSFLLDPKNPEVLDYTLRTATLLKLLSIKPAIHFCNLDKFLNCSYVTKKCECFQSLVMESGICRSQNLCPCGSAFSIGSHLYPNGPPFWKIEEMLTKSFHPHCIKNARCGNQKMMGKCTCKNGKAGRLCDGAKSVFASVLNPSNVKGYYKDVRINELFHSLNLLTYKMEQLMTLGYGDGCNPESTHLVVRIQGFYRAIGSSEETIARGKTLHQHRKVAKWIQHLLKSGVPGLCNQFVGLNCNPTSKKCSCATGTIFENRFCKLYPGQVCDPRPIATWIPRCRKNSHCKQNTTFITTTSISESKCICNEGWNGDNCATKINNLTLPFSSRSIPSRNIVPTENCPYSNITIRIGGITITECLDTDSDERGDEQIDDTTQVKNLTDTQAANDTTIFQNISLILDRIMRNRALGLNYVCEPELESKFTALFPSLPHFKMRHFNSLPQGKVKSSEDLRRIDADHTKFCDRKKYLVCHAGTKKCDCNPSVYVKEGRQGSTECRLKEGSFCGENGTVLDRSFNSHPKCQKGTKCSKVGYGVATCVSFNNDF